MAAHYGASERTDEAEARRRAVQVLELVGLPIDPEASPTLLGAGGLKKLELARALATGPRLLLADESLGGLDPAEMAGAAEMLRRVRGELEVTIVWVEHIMATLMRVVDRVVVLDHGEKIAEGRPLRGRRGPARDRGLSRREDRAGMSLLELRRRHRGLRRLHRAVGRRPPRRAPARRWRWSVPTAPARPRSCA